MPRDKKPNAYSAARKKQWAESREEMLGRSCYKPWSKERRDRQRKAQLARWAKHRAEKKKDGPNGNDL